MTDTAGGAERKRSFSAQLAEVVANARLGRCHVTPKPDETHESTRPSGKKQTTVNVPSPPLVAQPGRQPVVAAPVLQSAPTGSKGKVAKASKATRPQALAPATTGRKRKLKQAAVASASATGSVPHESHIIDEAGDDREEQVEFGAQGVAQALPASSAQYTLESLRVMKVPELKAILSARKQTNVSVVCRLLFHFEPCSPAVGNRSATKMHLSGEYLVNQRWQLSPF